MQRLLNSAIVGAAAAAALIATPAAATIYKATYRGIVDFGYDQTGLFGVAGRDLAGLRFTVVYTIDDAVNAQIYDSGEISTIIGGASSGDQSPTSAVLTIAGHSLEFAAGYNGSVTVGDIAPDLEYIGHTVNTHYMSTPFEMGQRFISNGIGGYGANFLNGADFRQPGKYTSADFVDANGNYSFSGQFEDSYASIDHTNDHHNFAYFIGESLTITAPAAAPEPAAWSLLIVGFGLGGASLRRRRMAVG